MPCQDGIRQFTSIIRRRRKPYRPQPQIRRYRYNEGIRVTPVRVVAENGENLGILETAEALRIAREQGLDLIEIAPTVTPPVCKIMDFGKFKYEREKGEREHSKKQKTVEVKGVRIGFTTGKHDLIRIAEKVEEFMEDGDKVRIDMVLHGREKAFRDMASDKFNEFMQLITREFVYEAEPKKTPQGFIAIIHKKPGSKNTS